MCDSWGIALTCAATPAVTSLQLHTPTNCGEVPFQYKFQMTSVLLRSGVELFFNQ